MAPFWLGIWTGPCFYFHSFRWLFVHWHKEIVIFSLGYRGPEFCTQDEKRMRQMCVPCVVRSAPPSQLVVSARSVIVMNVLMPTLVGNKLFMSQYMSDTH